MFIKMGVPGGVKRYMDATIVAILCGTPEEVTAATSDLCDRTEQACCVAPTTLPQSGTPGQPRVPIEANVTVTD